MLQGKEELIDRFLMGKATLQEQLSLNEMLQNNPDLVNQLNDEKILIEAIKNHRQAQLKNRLEKITVVDYSKYYKYATVFFGVALLTAGYFSYQRINLQEEQLNTKTSYQLLEQQKQEFAQPDIEQTTNLDLSIEKKSDVLVTEDVSKHYQNISLDSRKEKISEEVKPSNTPQKKSQVTEEESFDHSSVLPKLSHQISKDGEIELPESEIAKTPKIIGSKLTVSIEKKSGDFMYKFSSGKLYLYGDFSEKYEIIEWNKASSEALYLKYSENYFEINKNKHEITKLEKVIDENKIKLLKSFENND
ncbi:MAG: hypothetical protein SNJ77_04345 [Cytophagales bacterium]